MSSKKSELFKLTQLRRQTRWPGFTHIGDYHSGAYECEHVSPYTKSAANVDSQVFLLLQDWSSHARLSRPLNVEVQQLGHDKSLRTNKNLRGLLCIHFQMELSDVYATNLFPFVKDGNLSHNIPCETLVRATKEFALPQIQIVKPKLVVCLGLSTTNAMRCALGLERADSTDDAIAQPFKVDGVHYWGQSHPGHFGKINRNRGNPTRVTEDWQSMAAAFHLYP